MSRRPPAWQIVRHIALAALGAGALVARPGAARAELGSLGDVTVGIGLQAGVQPDSRSCKVGEASRSLGGYCMLFAGGLDVSVLYRGAIGGSIGLFSVAGQAAIAENDAPGFPDRISIPLLLDLRPLGFLVQRGDRSYRARALHGLRFGIGPSLEIIRISRESVFDWGERIGEPARSVLGMQATFDGEVPLTGRAENSVSLRLSVRVLYAPKVALDGDMTPGVIRSANFDLATVEGPPRNDQWLGLAPSAQVLLGLVYYP